jgi:hypothetical protein
MTSITVHFLDCDRAHLNLLETITAKYHQCDEVFRNYPRRYDREINGKPNSRRDRLSFGITLAPAHHRIGKPSQTG